MSVPLALAWLKTVEAAHGSVGSKRLGLKGLAERQGFEPWVQVLARTTV